MAFLRSFVMASESQNQQTILTLNAITAMLKNGIEITTLNTSKSYSFSNRQPSCRDRQDYYD